MRSSSFQPDGRSAHSGWVDRNSGPNFTVYKKNCWAKTHPDAVCISNLWSFSNYCYIFRKNRLLSHEIWASAKVVFRWAKTPVLCLSISGLKFIKLGTHVQKSDRPITSIYKACLAVATGRPMNLLRWRLQTCGRLVRSNHYHHHQHRLLYAKRQHVKYIDNKKTREWKTWHQIAEMENAIVINEPIIEKCSHGPSWLVPCCYMDR